MQCQQSAENGAFFSKTFHAEHLRAGAHTCEVEGDMGEGPQRLGDLLAGERLLLTTAEAARLLHVGRTTIYALIKAGVLHPVHIGRSCRLSIAELDRYVRRLEAPQRVPLRSPGRKPTPTDQGGLFDLDAVPVDDAAAVDNTPPTSHSTARLRAVDE